MAQWLYGFAVVVLVTLFFMFNVRRAINDWWEGRYWARLMKEAKTDEEWEELCAEGLTGACDARCALGALGW
jgi:hypothetical protein